MRLAPPTSLHVRANRVRALAREAGADACLITHPPNVFYLTGFGTSAGAVILGPDRLYLIADARYTAAAEALLGSVAGYPDATLVRVEDSYDETLINLIGRLDVRRIGIEAAHLPVRRFAYLSDQLRQRGEREVVQTLRLVERVRRLKDPFEIECLGEAGRLLSGLVPVIAGGVQPGRREREVAAEIDWQIRDRGFDKPAFDTIVASGENSALPHARPGDRVITPGDLVLLDFGGVLDGYCVDLSRTGCVGAPTPEAARLLDAVLEAQDAAIAAVRPGRRGSEVDGAARDVLSRYHLGEAFGHSTGHGLGLEVHEEPRLGRRPRGVHGRAEDEIDPVLQVGMVFTIEPGAYIPGLGGVRIEDDVLVTHEGCDVLTAGSHEIILGERA